MPSIGCFICPCYFSEIYRLFLLQGLQGTSAYLDDILVTGATSEEYLQNLNRMLNKLQSAGIWLNRDKCSFLQPSLEYLGHRIDEKGLHPTQDQVRAIKDAPRPTNVSIPRYFLGLLNYYGKFLPNLSAKLAPLFKLLNSRQKWYWRERRTRTGISGCKGCSAN